MNNINFSISSFLTNSLSLTSAIVGGTLLSSGAIALTYFFNHSQESASKKNTHLRELSHSFQHLEITSDRTLLNPLNLLSAAMNKIFSLVMNLYHFLFGEKESWMNQIPSPIHYKAFNGGCLSHLAQKARKNMKGLLEIMGAKEFKNSLANSSLPGWSGLNALTLPEDKKFSSGQFYLTGKEIKNLALSLRISYDPSILSASKLNNILVKGACSAQEKALARGRMVSSLVASVCDSKGNPISRKKELPLYRVYTSNAPNLAYSAYDRHEFVQKDGTLNTEKYTREMERIFLHYFKEAKANNDNVAILCGFGLGAFMTAEFLPDAQKCFVEALRRATDAEGKYFEKIIFADPNKKLTHAMSSIPNITMTNKSCLDIAHHGAKQGFKVALFNPGDGSGIPGQFWLKGHIALEEMFGLFTTLLIAQHPHCNPKVKDATSYFKSLD